MKQRPMKKAPQPSVKKATPEQQGQYDNVMLAARKVLFGDPKQSGDDSRFKMVLQRLSGSKENLPEAIGGITAVVLTNIAGAAKAKGRAIPDPILFHAGREIIADLIEIAVAAKIMDKGQTVQVTQQAVAEALKAYKAAQQQPQGQQAQPPAAAPAQPPQPAPQPQPGIINAARGV